VYVALLVQDDNGADDDERVAAPLHCPTLVAAVAMASLEADQYLHVLVGRQRLGCPAARR